jgi:methyl-accepting chemotaxis protein
MPNTLPRPLTANIAFQALSVGNAVRLSCSVRPLLLALRPAGRAPVAELERLLMAVVCLTPAMAGAILYVAFRSSHRIAGPTFRLVESLKRIASGDVDFRVRLRRGDLLTEIADELNRALDAIQSNAAWQRREPGLQQNAVAVETAAVAAEPSARTADVSTT